jgi:hypothetical protein
MNFRLNRILTPAIVVPLLLMQFLLPDTAGANSAIRDARVEYVFGGPITFQARLDLDQAVQDAYVTFKSLGDSRTLVGPAAYTDGYLEYIFDQAEQPLRAFGRVDYWFTVTLLDGSQITGDVNQFIYEDNRFAWRMLSSPPFHVHWYEGDLDFAQAVLGVAHEGLKRAGTIIPLPVPEEIHIYVYASSEELQATRRLSRRDGVAGHAEVDLGVMVVSLPNIPERRLETERQVPHELMHILLYQAIGAGYENIPTWLNEGLASIAELYPTPDYQIVLESAIARNNLIPISDLCRSFPPEMSGFILSYAESAYFTRYLYRTYGSIQLESMLAGYANGLDCERGFEAAYGTSLSAAEAQWLKETFNTRPVVPEAVPVTGELMPWFLLLFAVVALPSLMVMLALLKHRPAARVSAKSLQEV